jgi:hypothetical protein
LHLTTLTNGTEIWLVDVHTGEPLQKHVWPRNTNAAPPGPDPESTALYVRGFSSRHL